MTGPAFDLMPDEVAATLPALYGQEGAGDLAVVYVKWFQPGGSFTWYVTEYDPVERCCFGLVIGLETELGYFDLDEVAAVRYGPGRAMRIERDLYFRQATLREVRRLHSRQTR